MKFIVKISPYVLFYHLIY